MWKGKGRGAAQKPTIPEDPNKFLALATQIMAKLNGESEKKGGKATMGIQRIPIRLMADPESNSHGDLIIPIMRRKRKFVGQP